LAVDRAVPHGTRAVVALLARRQDDPSEPRPEPFDVVFERGCHRHLPFASVRPRDSIERSWTTAERPLERAGPGHGADHAADRTTTIAPRGRGYGRTMTKT